MYYGFKAFSTDYLTRHPGYYINPHDVNGSVIETIFGQMRHVAQQNLSSTNYASSRASLLTKWSICGRRAVTTIESNLFTSRKLITKVQEIAS